MEATSTTAKKRPINKFLKNLRKRLRRLRYKKRGVLSERQGNQVIKTRILEGTPSAIGKIGSVECSAMYDYLSLNRSASLKEADWGKNGYKLYKNAGVFPTEPDIYYQFCQIYESALNQMDLISVWTPKGEPTVIARCSQGAQLSEFSLLTPLFAGQVNDPWMEALQDKQVLIIHPFAQTISTQYPKRREIWPTHPQILPDFELHTLKIPMAASIVPSPYENWVIALEDLKTQMDAIEYDVALVGAGAWSLPLVAHAKAQGKVGIHTGGATQMFFGIKGRRWEKSTEPSYYTDAWVRPSPEETPESAHILEKACYW